MMKTFVVRVSIPKEARHKTNWKWSSLLATKGKDLHSSIEAAIHKTGFSGYGLTGTGKSY